MLGFRCGRLGCGARSSAAEGADVRDDRVDLRVIEVGAEAGHAGLTERRAAVLDQLVEVRVGARAHARWVGEITRSDQEQRCAPGAAPAAAVAIDAVAIVATGVFDQGLALANRILNTAADLGLSWTASLPASSPASRLSSC